MAMVRELLKHVFRKPATLRYPFEKREPFQGFRGRPVWDMDRCVGCELCFRDCPSGAIEMIGKGSEAEFKHHIDRCVFCGQCAEVCPTKAIMMTEDYELASYDKIEMIVEFKRGGPRVRHGPNEEGETA